MTYLILRPNKKYQYVAGVQLKNVTIISTNTTITSPQRASDYVRNLLIANEQIELDVKEKDFDTVGYVAIDSDGTSEEFRPVNLRVGKKALDYSGFSIVPAQSFIRKLLKDYFEIVIELFNDYETDSRLAARLVALLKDHVTSDKTDALSALHLSLIGSANDATLARAKLQATLVTVFSKDNS